MPDILRSCTAWLAILSSSTSVLAAVVGRDTLVEGGNHHFKRNSFVDEDSIATINTRATSDNKIGICAYLGFQSIFMQDRVYVDGGLLYYMTNQTAGNRPVTQSEFPSTSYIDLNKPFDFSVQQAAEKLDFFTPIEGIPGRTPLIFGGLLGNDFTWVQYGGMQTHQPTDSTKRTQRVSERYDYEKDPTNPTQNWHGDLEYGTPVTQDDSVTNYVYGGAVASSPGDKKSWWFSGVTGKNWNEVIFSRSGDLSPAGLSKYLITADLSNQQEIKFTNTTLDSKIAPRAGASMVFLPVGEKGILVVVGGVSVYDPIWMVPFGTREEQYEEDDLEKQATASRKFLQTIDIYDIASGKWYSQDTTGAIPSEPISAGCAVAASADDRSSHNIYFYGGHGGLSYDDDAPGSQTNSKFYVLTLPNFRWIEVLNPASGAVTGRSLHQCHRVLPNQMLIVGGHPRGNDQATTGTSCALYPGPGPAMVFDLNTCEVQNRGWNPEAKAEYQVPEKVTAIIGGSGTGGAVKKQPDDGWANNDLKELFSDPKAYTERVTPLWAYTSPTSTDSSPGSTTTPDANSDNNSSGSSFPKYIPPLLGTLLGLFALITILSIILFILRRRKQKLAADAAPSETEGTTVRKNKQTWSWLLGVYGGDEKSARGTHQPLGHMRNYSDDGTTFMYGTSSEGQRESVMSPISPVTERSDPVMELQGKTIHEMPDTSIPLELAARTGSPAVKNPSETSLKGDQKQVRYEDQQVQGSIGSPLANTGDNISSVQTGGTSQNNHHNPGLGHRKLSSLDYPE